MKIFFFQLLFFTTILNVSVAKTTSEFAHPIPKDNEVLLTLGNASNSTLPNKLSILVWNLHKGSNQTFATDFNELAHKKDLIVAQEMQLDPLMEGVFEAFPLNQYTTATSFFVGKEYYRTGVATASQVKPISSSYIRTTTLEPVIETPKVTLITQYPIGLGDKKLTIINIHGINFVDVPSFKIEIDRIYETIKSIPAPLIFTGDFNSWNGARLEILANLCQKMKLQEAKFFPDNRMRFNGKPLDHFFYTEDIRVLEAKVEGFYRGSDHKPLELVIEYKPDRNGIKKIF